MTILLRIPSLIVEQVDPNKMKTMAAILRDPYPVHWDKDANDTLGLKGRVINQGLLTLIHRKYADGLARTSLHQRLQAVFKASP